MAAHKVRKVTHEIASEEPMGLIDGTWRYKIVCSCGNAMIEAGPLPSGYEAYGQAYQMWQTHRAPSSRLVRRFAR